MLPMTIPQTPNAVRTFEVITPAGRVYQFPRPSLLQRLFMLLYPYADTAAVSAAIFGLLYVAGLAAEALEPLTFNACQDRMTRAIAPFEK
jgi:hypothetical protein